MCAPRPNSSPTSPARSCRFPNGWIWRNESMRRSTMIRTLPASSSRAAPTRWKKRRIFPHLTVRSDKPVVVVGSMRNPGTLGYEGAANLLEGFRVAAEPHSFSVFFRDEEHNRQNLTLHSWKIFLACFLRHPMHILANVILFLKPQKFLSGVRLLEDDSQGRILRLLRQR